MRHLDFSVRHDIYDGMDGMMERSLLSLHFSTSSRLTPISSIKVNDSNITLLTIGITKYGEQTLHSCAFRISLQNAVVFT